MTEGNNGTSLILLVPDGEAVAKTTDERSDLTDLVDYPRETLDIELKDWIDIGDKVAQAKLARHIAALANHGGGYLVFGFRDDESIAPYRPTDLSGYNRDTFGRIVTRYLTPAFQCDVQLVQSSAGLIYPVVRVPSHGSTPIGAKADDHTIRRASPDQGRHLLCP
ncbi:AlbA family DNA-binding domain-containing protein [Rhizobium leguminosarum]|uniref:AlbA family DNA-binding domain-containing protein n=1 Tax=Rhizobium leguminosarum TaxID=384 RepID=UPI001FEFA2DC|nr:ATP-binding protein [Rhizobium leguminosarum]